MRQSITKPETAIQPEGSSFWLTCLVAAMTCNGPAGAGDVHTGSAAPVAAAAGAAAAAETRGSGAAPAAVHDGCGFVTASMLPSHAHIAFCKEAFYTQDAAS